MTISNVNLVGKNLSFKGYDKHLDSEGNEFHRFYYPHNSNYKLQLETCLKDKNNGEITEKTTRDIEKDSIDITIPKDIDKNYDVYYRFKLTSKDGKTIYANDNGLIRNIGKVNESAEPFNQIYTDRKIVSKPGRMQLQLPDMFYPGIENKNGVLTPNSAIRAQVLSTLRTHVSKLGGTLNGMTYMLPQKAKEGYTRIVGTPFTKDEVSSHLYWTQNAYQMSKSLGGLQDMKRFQQALFKNGMNFVSDAALVNEGLQGIHFTNVLRWGEKSPFFNWFKTYDLDANLLSLGVLPKDKSNVRMRIINSPINCKSNPVEFIKYDSKKPTYVQLYDARLVSDKQLKENKPFSTYDKSTGNHYDITSYDDAIIPYYFEVNPQEMAQNIKKFDGTKEGAFSDIDTILNLLSFSKFKIGEREDGGIELWDGNVDIAKLNFSIGNNDVDTINKTSNDEVNAKYKDFVQGVREVQDYAVLSGKYWAKNTADIQLEFAANALKNINTLDDAINVIKTEIGKNLPTSVEKISEDVIKNVLNDNYNLFKLNNISTYTIINNDDEKEEKQISSYKDFVTKSIMNLPLEVLETDNDITSLLSSGYLTKRATTDEQIGLQRFDIYKSNYPNKIQKYSDTYKKMDNLLANDIYKFVDDVLNSYEKLAGSNKLKNEDGTATTFGKYAINAITSDIAKFALIKSLDKDAKITVEKDGSLNFDNIDRTKLGIRTLGIQDISPEKEIKNLVEKFSNGIKVLNNNQNTKNELAAALSVRLKDLNENSFKLADMIVDRTESGMGLRVDATKDIAAFDSVRNTKDDVNKAWKDVINFWTKYVKEGIQKENQHAFTTAEVTDVSSFLNSPVGDLKSGSDAERKLLKETGVTSIANYSYFFSMPTGIYSANPENGKSDDFGKINLIKSKIDCLDNPGWKDNSGLIFEGMPDSSIHSYTFVGNHDKPRILHVLGLDMRLYNSTFDNDNDLKIAKDVLMLDDENMLYEEIPAAKDVTNPISAPAIAMGNRIKNIIKDIEKIEKDNKTPENEKLLSSENVEKISYAIARLARGVYQIDGQDEIKLFHPTSFGEKPFDVVVHDVVKTANLDISKEKQKKLEYEIFRGMMEPAIKKFKSIYKMLVLLPGDPTDFAGDKEGLTGFESKCKNLTQQNRNAVRWEWLDKNNEQYYKPFVAQYNEEMNKILGLRERAELSALNNGHTISLVNYNTAKEFAHKNDRQYSANFRYNSEGSQVITIFGKPALKDAKPETKMGEKPEDAVQIDFLNLGKVLSREGLAAGLDENTVFVNADDSDKAEYKVKKVKIALPKEAPAGTDYTKFVYEDYDKNKGYITKKTDSYILRKYVNGKIVPIVITAKDDNALVLYKK